MNYLNVRFPLNINGSRIEMIFFERLVVFTMKGIDSFNYRAMERYIILVLTLLPFAIFLSCKSDGGNNIPVIETSVVTEITSSNALSGGKIIINGGTDIIAKGVCWGLRALPTTLDSHSIDGSGSGDFVSELTNLSPNTQYHVRAYARNMEGIGYGDEKVLRTLSGAWGGQIIADHTVVDKYDDIPQYYIDRVKEMWLSVPGESHSQAYRTGLLLLEQLNPKYAVSVVESGTPQAYTTSNLRASRATWGSYREGQTGWVYFYGEQDWFTSADAISRTKAGITYCNTHSFNIAAIGFGWCYDPDVNYTNINSYLIATQEYIDYCTASGYATKVFFTTGPIDGDSYTNRGNGGAYGYNIWLRMKAIRDYVALDETRILFDYADILAHDDDGTYWTLPYGGNSYEVISPINLGDGRTGHIGSAGSVRLAKAMWWMLARIAGWDGN